MQRSEIPPVKRLLARRVLHRQRLFQAANIEGLPAELRNQVTHFFLGCGTLTAIHHHWLDVVAWVGWVFEVLETAGREGVKALTTFVSGTSLCTISDPD